MNHTLSFPGLIALATLALTACDGKNEPEYTPAETPAETQRVYFAAPTVSEIVTADATAFNVNVYRPENEKAGELTVQLLFTDESHLFSIPQAVTFAAGEHIASIPVAYDASAMTPNKVYPVYIAIDEANANQYGIASVQININYEVMTDWALFGYEAGTAKDGLGIWHLGSIFTGNDLDGARVMERHIPSNPKIIEYTLQIWDGDDAPDTSLPIDSELWFTCLRFSTDDGGKHISAPLQPFALADGFRCATANVLFPDLFGETSNWDDTTGTFTLNIMYADDEGAYNPGDETIVLNGYAD